MEPSITTEDAQAAADKANALLDTEIELSDGIDTFYAERSDKVQWFEFLTKDDGSLDEPSISTVKVADWSTPWRPPPTSSPKIASKTWTPPATC